MTDLNAWKEARRKGLGGSDMPIVLGVSKFSTPERLWREKIWGDEEYGESESYLYMDIGIAMEPLIREFYNSLHPDTPIEIQEDALIHPAYEWLIGNIDGFLKNSQGEADIVVEIKAPTYRTFRKIRNEGLEDYYLIQVQHYMLLTGTAKALVLVASQGDYFALQTGTHTDTIELLEITVEADSELQEIIIREGAKFWEHVEQQIPLGDTWDPQVPELETSPPAGTAYYTSTAWQKLMHDLETARAEKTEAMECERVATAQIKTIMDRDHATLGIGYGEIKYSHTAGRWGLDRGRLKREKPEIYAEYLKQGLPGRRFQAKFD